MKKWIVVVVAFAMAGFTACNSEEKKGEEETGPEELGFYYRVSGDEQTGRTTVRLQFRMSGFFDSTFLLQEPSHVMLDGQRLTADSTPLNGIYYEADMATDSFAGKHEIIFVNPEGKKYVEPFEFAPFTLASLPDTLSGKEDVVLEISGLEDGEYLHLILIDTSFQGNGVEKMEPLKNGKLVITAEELAGLKKGPVYLDLIWDVKRRLKSQPESGWLFRSYRMKREFWLE